MGKETNIHGLDNVYFEIHKDGERVVIIPSALITKDLLKNFRDAYEKIDQMKKMILDNPCIKKELKKTMISDLYDIQKLIKFWQEYGKE